VKKLSDLLWDRESSGVYLLEAAAPTKELERLAADLNFAFFRLEGSNIEGKDQFLREAAAAFRFPEYFGSNWDAFADCLTDMSWHDKDGYVILYDDFRLFAEHSRADFETALDIFKESAEFWRNQAKSLFVLLRGKGREGWNLASIKC
jgi:RNAse (barnase) inhibitor barstar